MFVFRVVLTVFNIFKTNLQFFFIFVINANQFSPDPTVCTVSAPCWNQVRAVRFWVLVRADCPESGYTDTNKYYMGNLGTLDPPYEPNDHYRRALYAATVTLRN